MREKLLSLIKNEGITPSKLAELLGVQPSGISHIMSGRNKPSFDFVQKILRRFPNINPDWLLLDSQQMYRSESNAEAQPSENSIFPATMGNDSTDPQNGEQSAPLEAASSNISAQSVTDVVNIAQTNTRRGNIKRIIVLYDDRSFESYEVER